MPVVQLDYKSQTERGKHLDEIEVFCTCGQSHLIYIENAHVIYASCIRCARVISILDHPEKNTVTIAVQFYTILREVERL